MSLAILAVAALSAVAGGLVTHFLPKGLAALEADTKKLEAEFEAEFSHKAAATPAPVLAAEPAPAAPPAPPVA